MCKLSARHLPGGRLSSDRTRSAAIKVRRQLIKRDSNAELPILRPPATADRHPRTIIRHHLRLLRADRLQPQQTRCRRRPDVTTAICLAKRLPLDRTAGGEKAASEITTLSAELAIVGRPETRSARYQSRSRPSAVAICGELCTACARRSATVCQRRLFLSAAGSLRKLKAYAIREDLHSLTALRSSRLESTSSDPQAGQGRTNRSSTLSKNWSMPVTYGQRPGRCSEQSEVPLTWT